MNKIWIWVLIVVVVLGGAWYLMRGDSAVAPSEDTVTGSTMPVPGTNTTDTEVTGGTQGIAPGEPNPSAPIVKEFTVTAANFSYDVKNITVKKGETVRVVFKNAEGFHDWVIDEFSARTKQIKAGATETIEFVADKAGTFEYYCSVGQHRANGMKGTLVVQ